MANNTDQLDIIKIIQELNKCNFNDFELSYGKLKIKINSNNSFVATKSELPEATAEDFESMRQDEKAGILELLNQRDESALEELDFVAPELAGELLRSNEIKVGPSGAYEYVERETINA